MGIQRGGSLASDLYRYIGGRLGILTITPSRVLVKDINPMRLEIDVRRAAQVLEFDKNKSCVQVGAPPGIGRLKLCRCRQFA